jgi:transcriptional regulator with XRE-family HTH domain
MPITTLEVKLPRGPLGERVRAVRLVRGLSQAEAARQIGISKNSMNMIEHGDIPNPKANVIRRLAEVLEIPADYLLGVGENSVEEAPEEVTTTRPQHKRQKATA